MRFKSLSLLIIWNNACASLAKSFLRESARVETEGGLYPSIGFQDKSSTLRGLEHGDFSEIHTADYLYEVWFKEFIEEPGDEEVECMEETIKENMPIFVKRYLVKWLGYDPTIDWGEVDMVQLDKREREKIYEKYLKDLEKREKMEAKMQDKKDTGNEVVTPTETSSTATPTSTPTVTPTLPAETVLKAKTDDKKQVTGTHLLELEVFEEPQTIIDNTQEVWAPPFQVGDSGPTDIPETNEEPSPTEESEPREEPEPSKEELGPEEPEPEQEPEPANEEPEPNEEMEPTEEPAEKVKLGPKGSPKKEETKKTDKKDKKKKKGVKETHLIEMKVFEQERAMEKEQAAGESSKKKKKKKKKKKEAEEPKGGGLVVETIKGDPDELVNVTHADSARWLQAANAKAATANANTLKTDDHKKALKKKLRRKRNKKLKGRWNGKFRIRAKCRFCNPDDLDHSRRFLKKKDDQPLSPNYHATPDFQEFMEKGLKKQLEETCKELRSQMDFGIFTYLGLEEEEEEQPQP